jgi:hypothetical protein
VGVCARTTHLPAFASDQSTVTAHGFPCSLLLLLLLLL